MVRGIVVDGSELTEADMEIGEEQVPSSDLFGMPLRVRRLDVPCSREPYLISQFMGAPAQEGGSDWNFGGAGGAAPQVFVARADGVPFFADDFHRCLEKPEASAGALAEDEEEEFEEGGDYSTSEDQFQSKASDESGEEPESDEEPATLDFGRLAVREFRELLSNGFLPSRRCAFAQNFGMASPDDTLNSFVFGLWSQALKRDEGMWSAIAALQSAGDVPPLFDSAYSKVANSSESNTERKGLVRFGL